MSGPSLAFGELTTTRMVCPDGMHREQAYVAALSAVAGWRLADGRLALLDSTGRRLLEFTARTGP